MKLNAVGFLGLNFPMASSDDAHSRTDIMKVCASRMGFPIESYIYVGDAQWDLRAAEELGWGFIGVGKRLKGKCDIWVPDLLNKTPFLALSDP